MNTQPNQPGDTARLRPLRLVTRDPDHDLIRTAHAFPGISVNFYFANHDARMGRKRETARDVANFAAILALIERELLTLVFESGEPRIYLMEDAKRKHLRPTRFRDSSPSVLVAQHPIQAKLRRHLFEARWMAITAFMMAVSLVSFLYELLK